MDVGVSLFRFKYPATTTTTKKKFTRNVIV